MQAQLSRTPTASQEVAGRSCSDIGFNLALAGCANGEVFAELCGRAEHELRRKTARKAKGASVAAMVERLAAAGCQEPITNGLHEVALERLCQHDARAYADTIAALSQRTLRLHTPRAARWIHRRHSHHSLTAAQRRVAPGPSVDGLVHLRPSASRIGALFADEGRALTVDLGCGFGVGALGLATTAEERAFNGAAHRVDNVLGCDVNHAAIAFAHGVASRWGMSDRCAFVCSDAVHVMRRLQRGEYVGCVDRLVLSCPTPYAIQIGERSFPRAPKETLDFFADAAFFRCAASTLTSGGVLLMAANVEDVALTLFENAMSAGCFEPIVVPDDDCATNQPLTMLTRTAAPYVCDDPPKAEASLLHDQASWRKPKPDGTHARGGRSDARQPQRQLQWRRFHQARAIGPAWSSGRLLLPEARSETELAYDLEGRETYRIALRKVT